MKKIVATTGIILMLFLIIGVSGQETEVGDGYQKIYYPTGELSSEGIIKNGKPDGFWKTYYPNGVLKSEGNRKNFILDSIWVFYNEAGDTVEKVHYVMGKKNGFTLGYNAGDDSDLMNRGRVVSEELYVNDMKEGISKYYYLDGKIREEVRYSNNKRSGEALEYDRAGMVITVNTYKNGVLVERERINRKDEDGLKSGIWREYYDDGRILSEGYYDAGLLSGQYKEYDNSGNISLLLQYQQGLIVEDADTGDIDIEIRNRYDSNGNMIYSGSYRDSIPIGIHREFDSQGHVTNAYLYDEKGVRLGEGIITNEGSKEGEWRYFFPGGKTRSYGRYSNNREEGKWEFYFVDGKLEQEGEYRSGRANGLWTWYYEDGRIKREDEYYNGLEEGTTFEYDTVGNVIASGSYFDGEKEGEWYVHAGDVEEKGKYVGGLRDGKWQSFYENGQLKYEGYYIQGNPDGLHRFYYPDGVIKEENYYNMGMSEKNWKKYDEEGNLIITITYRDNEEYRINGEKIDFAEDGIRSMQ